MPTGRENEVSIGVVIERFAIARVPKEVKLRNLPTDLTAELVSRFARSGRFAPTSRSQVREGLAVAGSVDELKLDTGGRQHKAIVRIALEGTRLAGGRVAQMNERAQIELDKERDLDRQLEDAITRLAAPFFVRFVDECDKRY